MKNPGWNLMFSRELDPAESIDLLEIKYELRNVTLVHAQDDYVERDGSTKYI